MAKLNNWDIIALTSYGASWTLIGMGIFGGLPPGPWAWIGLILGIWPAAYAIKRFII